MILEKCLSNPCTFPRDMSLIRMVTTNVYKSLILNSFTYTNIHTHTHKPRVENMFTNDPMPAGHAPSWTYKMSFRRDFESISPMKVS